MEEQIIVYDAPAITNTYAYLKLAQFIIHSI